MAGERGSDQHGHPIFEGGLAWLTDLHQRQHHLAGMRLDCQAQLVSLACLAALPALLAGQSSL